MYFVKTCATSVEQLANFLLDVPSTPVSFQTFVRNFSSFAFSALLQRVSKIAHTSPRIGCKMLTKWLMERTRYRVSRMYDFIRLG